MHNIAQPMNHLLTIQLVNQPSAPSTKTNFKPQYFYFLTLAPGAGNGSNRTYDFSNKINMKFSIAEVFGLAFTLQQVAGGNPRVLPYSKFSKSGTGTKVVSIIENTKQTQHGTSRVITIFVSCNSQKYSLNLAPAEAYALAKQLDLSATDATKFEFARLSSSPTVKRSNQTIQTEEPPMPNHDSGMPPAGMPPVGMPPVGKQSNTETPPWENVPAGNIAQPETNIQQDIPFPQSQPSVVGVVDKFSNMLTSQVQT